MSGARTEDEILDRMVLDVKALALIHGSEPALRDAIAAKVMDSPDDEIQMFVSAVRHGRREGNAKLFAIALGEIVLASLLVLAGAVTLVPTIIGLTTPGEYVSYYAEQFYGTIGNLGLGQYVSVVEFGIGAFLMIAAFYTLRQAAISLREAGLSAQKGG